MQLPNGVKERENALTEFIFNGAPDVAVLNTAGGVHRVRDLRKSVLNAAVAAGYLVGKARTLHKTRKDLRRTLRNHGPRTEWRRSVHDLLPRMMALYEATLARRLIKLGQRVFNDAAAEAQDAANGRMARRVA